jgi:hypothetical protein
MLLFGISRHPQNALQMGLTVKRFDRWDENLQRWAELMSDFPIRIIEILRTCPNGLSTKDIAVRLGTIAGTVGSRPSRSAKPSRARETYEHARGMEIVRDGSLNCGDKIVCA